MDIVDVLSALRRHYRLAPQKDHGIMGIEV